MSNKLCIVIFSLLSVGSQAFHFNGINKGQNFPRSTLDMSLQKVLVERGKKIFRKIGKFGLSSSIILSTLLPTSFKPSKAEARELDLSQILKPRTVPSDNVNKNAVVGSSFVRDAVRAVGPSVVRIDCQREVSPFMSMLMPEFNRDSDSMKVSGSGIVVSSDGYILTNAHVVNNANSITITLSNGRTFKATLIASDDLTDLAAIKAHLDDEVSLVKAPIGDSSALQSGDWMIAVGCPVGLDFTVTLGIVSSPRRSAAEVGAPHLKGTYIQTDAALNSGNSGGPLVNERGEVVGINTMVRSNTEAIGFAIPINRAKEIFEILKHGRRPTHAYFGLEVATISPDNARISNENPNAIRLPPVHGALVMRVTPGAPSALSSFRKYDVIVEVNGNPILNADDADVYLDACKPNSAARIKVARGEDGRIVELFSTPKDLLSVIEERRMQMMKRQLMQRQSHVEEASQQRNGALGQALGQPPENSQSPATVFPGTAPAAPGLSGLATKPQLPPVQASLISSSAETASESLLNA